MKSASMLLALLFCLADSPMAQAQEETGYLETGDSGPSAREVKVDAVRKEFPGFSGLRLTPAGTARITEWGRMSQEERQEFESFVSCFFPQVWSELHGQRKENPAIYDSQMSRLAPELVPLIDQLVDKKDRTILQIKEKQLGFELQKLQSDFVHETNERSKERIGKDLARKLGERIDVQQKRRKLDLKRLEQRIEALRSMIEEVDQNREALIKRDQDLLLNPTAKASAEPKESSARKSKEEG